MSSLSVRHAAACAAVLGACAASAQPLGGGGSPPVMGWVPAYGIEAAAKALEANPQIGQAMTRIGLQFWNPGPDGRTVVLAPVDAHGRPVSPADVLRMVQWARRNGVQPLLTVYNNSQVINRWDWPLARRAFVDHPEEFTAALLDAVDQWKLDGVDLDLEGEGDYEADRPAYAAFVRGLSAELKARGKLLTVDSFHSPCANAPNMRWWADWVGQVAAVHSMGYTDLYEGSQQSFTPEGKAVCENGAALFRYSWQMAWGLRAGYRRDQIVMGMPTWVDAWGSGGLGANVVDHLREVRATGGGVGLWDLQLQAPEWSKGRTWDTVASLRRPGTAVARRALPAAPRLPDYAPARAIATRATTTADAH